jgi:hypothetical protein
MDFAYTEDLQCASIRPSDDGRATVEFTLIPYVSELTLRLAQSDGPLIGRLCLVGPDQNIEVTRSHRGHRARYMTLEHRAWTVFRRIDCGAPQLFMQR